MPRSRSRTDLEDELRRILKRNREAFMGRYKQEIDDLLSLSREDIDAITPGTTDLQIYDSLIEVVKEASRRNLAQAQLKARIKRLGDIAVQIAMRVPSLAALLA